MRFCLTGLIQAELDRTRTLWNSHYVRKTKNADAPPGRPDVLYYTPALSRGYECKFPLSDTDFSLPKSYTENSTLFGCTDEMLEFASIVMKENNMDFSTSAQEGKELFTLIIEELDNI